MWFLQECQVNKVLHAWMLKPSATTAIRGTRQRKAKAISNNIKAYQMGNKVGDSATERPFSFQRRRVHKGGVTFFPKTFYGHQAIKALEAPTNKGSAVTDDFLLELCSLVSLQQEYHSASGGPSLVEKSRPLWNGHGEGSRSQLPWQVDFAVRRHTPNSDRDKTEQIWREL